VVFAVHRPGNPVASPRSHRMPCGDVPGRVHISMAGVSAGGAPEDGLALAGEVLQRLLLHRLRALRQPRVLRPGLGELPALFQEARRAGPARTPVRVLLDSEVPHVPGVRAVASQHGFLGGRGKQPVAGHANTLAIVTDISGEVKRRFLPAKAEVSSPRS